MTLRAAGATDVGVQRDVNEDRYLSDPDRGIFTVIDGVGGQAAGGRAADTALDVIRARLTNGNGAVPNRIREAITLANNEVHRQAASRPEWRGMACVLTAVMIDGDRAVIGHVGDTRLYKLRGGKIQKLTPDHSPVGEREDSGEISELDAMRHPRRNEVYRDVGSEPHEVGDSDFVDVRDTPMEPDAALLLCSDGLTDLVASDEIQRVVRQHAGKPDEVTRALVKAANDAGGKDNITVVYVEGERFADETRSGLVSRGKRVPISFRERRDRRPAVAHGARGRRGPTPATRFRTRSRTCSFPAHLAPTSWWSRPASRYRRLSRRRRLERRSWSNRASTANVSR